MRIDQIRKEIAAARANDGKVDAAEVDRLVLKARDGGSVDPTERAELARQADSFSEPVKQRLLQHLSVVGHRAAYVNIEEGKGRTVVGRYIRVDSAVEGLRTKLGLFDSTVSLEGRAKADGTFTVTIEGRKYSVTVNAGDRPAEILERLRSQLPSGLEAQLVPGRLNPAAMESFREAAATQNRRAAHLVIFKPGALGLKPGERPMRVVVTGYGEFMGITDNPSDAMARKLAELGAQGAIIEYRHLEVEPGAVDAFVEEMKANPPDIILSMGVGSPSQLEEHLQNHLAASVDGHDRPFDEREVVEGGKPELDTDLPAIDINRALRRFGKLRVVGSSALERDYQPDRSAYLCNYLGYRLSEAFGQTSATTAGFVHVTNTTPPEQMHALLDAVASSQRRLLRDAKTIGV